MKRSLSSFLLVCFVLWVLPLGFYIKPSLQKLACDGQRAICMCHAFVFKTSDQAMEPGIALKPGASTNKENASGGTSNNYISLKPAVILNLQQASFFETQYFSYKSPFLAALEYVPKI